MFVFAKDLRNKEKLNKIPSDRPGYYKWWAKENEADRVCNLLGVDCKLLEMNEIFGEKYLCIYVGVAIKESIKSRLDWHINQVNDKNNVRLGTLSTLRQSISALFGESELDTFSTNEFIDKLVVEFYASENEIKSDGAKVEISAIENGLLSDEYVRPLNIQGNKNPLSPVKKLKEMRKSAKERALCDVLKLVLIGCVKKKADKKCPANELYISDRFVTCYKYAKILGGEIYILSAKYGIISENEIIEPYDKTLNSMKKFERAAWAVDVFEKLKRILMGHKFVEITILAGQNYYENLIELIKNDFDNVKINFPLKHLKLGEQNSFMKKEIAKIQ